MDGLRKVVKLRIFDIPKGKAELKKENNSYYYMWRNRYYIGNSELHKSKQFNNVNRKPLLNKNCDDDYLDKLISKIVSNDNNPEENIFIYDDFLFYDGDESSIYYFGDNFEKIKKKISKK